MEIAGRLTADATINTLQGDRQVVNFTIVQNDSYKTKDGERRNVATFFKCAYWMSSKIATSLKKGTIVLLSGRIGVDVWNNMKGEAKAALTFHTNNIKFIGGGKSNAATIESVVDNGIPAPQTVDDLPF